MNKFVRSVLDAYAQYIQGNYSDTHAIELIRNDQILDTFSTLETRQHHEYLRDSLVADIQAHRERIGWSFYEPQRDSYDSYC